MATLIFLFSLFLGNCFVTLEASHHLHYNLQTDQSVHAYQSHRSAYHFQPPKNWINDPNGPMIHKGLYHLFYQYNPKGAVWGNIVWAHSTSKDLVNWTPHDPAIYPSQQADINGCWSGSATILPGDKPVIMYTGIDPNQNQVQNLAMPKNLSDPYLTEWVKFPKNPIMSPTVMNKINASSFRDPTTAWKGPDGRWRLVVGSKRHHRGLAYLYWSKDFIKWTKTQHPLHSVPHVGMWECPDFFPVSVNSPNGVDTSSIGAKVKHVLKVSLDDYKHEYYTIGSYNITKDIYIPDDESVDNERGLRYDYGKFYASKTFFDNSKNRRILWGWINESSPQTVDVIKGWSGVQAIPRSLWLHKSGKYLMQWPVKEIEQLRKNPVKLPSQVLKGGSVIEVTGVTAAQADVEISFEVSKLDKAEELDSSWTNPRLLCSKKQASVKGNLGPFGLLVMASKSLEEQTAVFFRVFKNKDKYVVLMCSDQSRSSLDTENDLTTYGAFVDLDPAHDKLSLRTMIDHSIVESFGGEGKACMTARVYPTSEGETHLYAFNNGTEDVKISKLNAWSMKAAHIY